MEKYFKLLDVVHNGRKGLRGSQMCDRKYEGLIGAHCKFDLDNIQQFKPLKFEVINSLYYDYWHTSEVLEVAVINGVLEIETANSIYRFRELE